MSSPPAEPAQATVQPVARPLNLIPVTLKEAALDSPSFRATTLHFADQIDLIERWLDGYVKAASTLVTEVGKLEHVVNNLLAQSTPPSTVGEAVLDHDYTLLAMRRYGEGAREFWSTTLRGAKRYDTMVVEPIKGFLNSELRNFKDARRMLESTQKNFDHVLGRYLGQSKTKEASSLREDAFQLHEARKAYLKASMDFCVSGPNLRASLDKLIVRIFSEQWKELRSARDSSAALFAKTNSEMERVRGWSRDMEESERAFKRELQIARKQIEESAWSMTKPSRELEDYAASTVPYLGATQGPAKGESRNEKQSWLFIKTTVGKPARTVWNRRWFYVKNGIFGWLIVDPRTSAVAESDRIGVLLCSVRPAFSEERRFCFEVKTKDSQLILQAETQAELTEWISAFEMAKRKALEDPASTEQSPAGARPGVDPAFAITPPVAPEFAARMTTEGHGADEAPVGGLGSPELNPSATPVRASFDVSSNQQASSAARRVLSLEREPGEGSRDHAARIIQKLDLHGKRGGGGATPSIGSGGVGAAGGIASLISASHHILPVGPGAPPTPGTGMEQRRNFTGASTATFPTPPSTSTLAPSTLANPPAPTNLSHTAVVVSGERGLGLGRGGGDGSGMPSGIMANLWGSSNWGWNVNKLSDEPVTTGRNGQRSVSVQSTDTMKTAATSPLGLENGAPRARAVSFSKDDVGHMDGTGTLISETTPSVASAAGDLGAGGLGHRKTLSLATDGPTERTAFDLSGGEDGGLEYPNYYPLPLKAQQAQFRMLFPSVPAREKLVLVFRATWNPNDQQEFPGRVYVTEREIYFYSNHLGLVLITGVGLLNVEEATGAPGRECDYLYLHLRTPQHRDGIVGDDEPKRITIKVFLEPLKLLQRRLNFLVHNARAEQPLGLEEVIKKLIRMEVEEPKRSSSVESWEDVTFDSLGGDGDTLAGDQQRSPGRRERNVKASLRIDGTLYGDSGAARTGREVQKFKLPGQAVVYAPKDMQASISRDFNVSAKALFHVMFGDKSAVFQLLYSNRWADKIVQSAWKKAVDGHWSRTFESQGHATPMQEEQRIDILNDHLCYVVTNTKVAWRLPYAKHFVPMTKIVITHTAKSKCKLAVFQAIAWTKPPGLRYLQTLVEKEALNSLEADALDLSNVAMDQVAKLGSHSKTNRAIEIFGAVGQQASVPQLDTSSIANLGGSAATLRQRQRKPVGVVKLIVDDVLQRMLQSLGWLLDIVMALSKSVLGVFTAHTLLVALLAFSVLYNGWYGYRDGVAWYHERSASAFMSRVGVRPQAVLSRAVYLQDIDSLIAAPAVENGTLAAMQPEETGAVKTCRTTFSEQLTSSPSLVVGKATGARLQRTRDSLAQYRHDLLVALRVVNSVERQVVQEEWQDWVQSEERKCARVERMLRQRSGKGKDDGQNEAADMGLGEDFAEYCASCRTELSGLSAGEAGNGTRALLV